jgi:hypothetical protein
MTEMEMDSRVAKRDRWGGTDADGRLNPFENSLFGQAAGDHLSNHF